MKLGIMQPYFFPYIGYWQLINAVDIFVIYDDVNYIKGGWINRNKILLNGKENYINLLLNKSSSNKLINEIELLENPVYKRKLLKKIELNYNKSPFYNEVYPLIEGIIMQKEKMLSRYLEHSIKVICNYLEIDTIIIKSSDIIKNNNLNGKYKVIDICERLSATEYINPIGGKNLYSTEEFKLRDLTLNFLESKEIHYLQFNQEFIPNLSIIDVMMFNEKLKIKEFLFQYNIV